MNLHVNYDLLVQFRFVYVLANDGKNQFESFIRLNRFKLIRLATLSIWLL